MQTHVDLMQAHVDRVIDADLVSLRASGMK